MKKIYVPMIRYGDSDFDEGFIGWGFNSYDEQIRDAVAVLNLLSRHNMDMLDLGCGLGIYHKAWLEAGHSVCGVDISETFIFMAKYNNPAAVYRRENFFETTDCDAFDAVVMIDVPLENLELAQIAFRALKKGGAYIFQASNPDYPHMRGQSNVNQRNWVDVGDSKLLLTRNEYNAEIDRWEYEEWVVDVENSEITVQHNFSKNLDFSRLTDLLIEAGFSTVGFYDYDGRQFFPGAKQPKNVFCVASKGFADKI